MSTLSHRRVFSAVIAALILAATCAGADPASRDSPLEVIQTVQFDFDRLAFDSTMPATGEVRVLVLIDQTGRLHDFLVLGAIHPAFIAPVADGLKQWQFIPPKKDGKPIGARTTLRIFVDLEQRAAAVAIMEPAAVSIMEAVADKLRAKRDMGFENYLVSAKELDQPLRLLRQASPVVPAEWAGEAREAARVLVDFFIDQTGRPRMPVIEQSPDSLLSGAVLDALAQWQFEPPIRNRLPAIVRVKQEFTFPRMEPIAPDADAEPESTVSAQ